MPHPISTLPLFRDQCYINGQWINSTQTIAVHNPTTGEQIGTIPMLSGGDIKTAITHAHTAQKSWAKTTAKHRATVLKKWHDLILQNQNELATIITAEMGKPTAESLTEIINGASYIEWYAEESKRLYGNIIPPHAQGQRSLVIRQPIGVVGAITPWNFPNGMITRKVAPALSAGCTVVLKPAPATPYSALALAELAHQAGIPAGVLNVVTGDAQTIGAELCTNPQVRKITFTGSTAVGKILLKQSADTVKKVSLELGGNAPSIVFEDADLNTAVDNIMASKFRNNGQTCVCTNRIYVHDSIAENFTNKLKHAVEKLQVGDPTNPTTTQGCLINKTAMERVHNLVQSAIAQGANCITGGNPHPLGGSFYQPTILTNVTHTMDIANTEIFAPVACIYTYTTDEQVIAYANNTPYGLSAYVYTQNMPRMWHMAEALEYGIVGINTGNTSSETIPFGGIKESGMGREGSKYGIEDFTEIKYICMGGLELEK